MFQCEAEQGHPVDSCEPLTRVPKEIRLVIFKNFVRDKETRRVHLASITQGTEIVSEVQLCRKHLKSHLPLPVVVNPDEPLERKVYAT